MVAYYATHVNPIWDTGTARLFACATPTGLRSGMSLRATTSFRREDREWNMVHGHRDLFVTEQGINETVRECSDAIAGSGKWGSEESLWIDSLPIR
jgi:hypothetical protein